MDNETNREEVQVPELTADQKLRIVLLQRQILGLKVEIHDKQEQLKQLDGLWQATLNGLALELKIDASKFTFDPDNLVLKPKS